MKITITLSVLLAALVFTACNEVSYKKTRGGMPYKLFSSSKGKAVDTGNFIRIQVLQKINDSVIFDTYGKLPMYMQVTEQVAPYNVSELWLNLKEGDSLITVQAMDTFIKRNPYGVPPQFKNGDRIYSTFVVEKVYPTEEEFRADEKRIKDEFLAGEVKVVGDYVAKKNINAVKTKSGAYVEIIEPGTGPLIDSGKVAMALYRGTSFSGKIFDSNMDSSFGRSEPVPFTVGISGQPNGLTLGFDECMMLLRKGSKARLYIPSMLAYGPQPPTPDIQPFEHLIFDVEVKDVLDKMPAPEIQTAPNVQINPPDTIKGKRAN